MNLEELRKIAEAAHQVKIDIAAIEAFEKMCDNHIDALLDGM